MREYTYIAAAQDCYTSVESHFEAGAFADDTGWVGLLAFLPAGVLSGCVARRECWTKRDAMFRHQFENLGRAVVAVLDGLRAAENRAPHAFGRDRMHRHRHACT